MILDYNTYKDKVSGCFCGKNIGGCLGAPFETFRQINEVDFYTQDLSNGAPPNDDLDLQILWLSAVEKFGRQLDSSILGEYWLSYVVPNWVEYGMAKANLRSGLMPPLSGEIDNTYGQSCGAFIRSEIWACLAPGHPDIAVKYAYEDAIVDHTKEGVWGEIFCAALESAAFVESDKEKLVDIALSYIPEKCLLRDAINEAICCYKEGASLKSARERIHAKAPGTFGLQGKKLKDIPKENNENMELGVAGLDTPENVAFMIAALFYGEDDFEKSLLCANYFGEDTDCTCATLCALFGIINGEKKIPTKWRDPLDDKIATMCIKNTSVGIWIPKTSTELTERILRVTPAFLGQEICDIFAKNGMTIECKEGNDLYSAHPSDYMYRINSFVLDGDISSSQYSVLSPYEVKYEFPAMRIIIDLNDSVFIKKGDVKSIRVKVYNAFYLNEQQWIKINAYTNSNVNFLSGKGATLPLNNLSQTFAEKEFVIDTSEISDSEIEIIFDCSIVGRHSSGIVKVKLFAK